MSGIDPQILIYKLSELTEEIKRCTNVQRDTIRQALYTQTHAQERVNQNLHDAGIVVHQVECDRQNIEEEKIKVTQQLSKCIQATETSHATLREVESALKIATATLNKWNAELQKALQWLTRAEARLQLAVAEYQAAQTNLQYAKNAVDRAEAALRRCMNDKERTNCNSEGRAYESAREELLIAIARLEAAEVELRLAQEEVERAKARVNCCQNAVRYAEQAVGYAQEALENANQAVNSAERSLEEVEAAERHIVAAEEKANEEQEIADEMMQKVRQAETLSNQGFSVYLTGYKAGEYAKRLATLGCQEIASRVEELYRLNIQEPLFSIPGTSEIVYAQPLPIPKDTQPGSGSRDENPVPLFSIPGTGEIVNEQPLPAEANIIPGIGFIDENIATPSISEFAKNLNYQQSQDPSTKSIRIKAINPENNTEIGDLTAEKPDGHRVRIKDTNVAEEYRGQNNPNSKGIGTMLLQTLENQLSDGTELYFYENQAEGFWKKMGFQESDDSNSPNGKKYSKIVSSQETK